MCRTYLIDYVALLLMVVILVISEEAVPFTRYIYHIDDQVCLLLLYLHIQHHVFRTLTLNSRCCIVTAGI